MTSLPTSHFIQRLYLALTLLSTLAASLIWGIDTLFQLSAGLSNTQVFLVNGCFMIGQMIFEVPTGIVADAKGRRTSYLLGTLTLGTSTLLYLGAWMIHAPVWIWAGSSFLLGLGFTFFSGATEAWLVDALAAVKHKGELEEVFAKGQMVSGVAMLLGSVLGGAIAQFTNLGVPYLVRGGLLFFTFAVAWIYMKDWGFTPAKTQSAWASVKNLFTTSLEFSWRRPGVRWMMLSGPFTMGVSFYAFYAMQPYLLQLFGNPKAYGVAGLAAAIVAGARIAGGWLAPQLKKLFPSQTQIVLVGTMVSTGALILVGLLPNFWVAIALLCVWGLVFAATMPARQAYLNSLIPSHQRATILSFDSLVSSGGGVVIQPVLGRVADGAGYAVSFVVGGLVQICALPFLFLVRQHHTNSSVE